MFMNLYLLITVGMLDGSTHCGNMTCVDPRKICENAVYTQDCSGEKLFILLFFIKIYLQIFNVTDHLDMKTTLSTSFVINLTTIKVPI